MLYPLPIYIYISNTKEICKLNKLCVYFLVQCETCRFQYVTSTSKKNCIRFNNHKSCLKKHNCNEHVTQVSFHIRS